MTDPTIEMPRYKCHKQVYALKIAEIGLGDDSSALIVPDDQRYANFRVGPDYMEKHNPVEGGYFVQYDDGYMSFSPAEAFEAGYAPIDQESSDARQIPQQDPMRKADVWYDIDPAQKDQINTIKSMGNHLVGYIDSIGKPCREFSKAKTDAEQAVMWAVKGITG